MSKFKEFLARKDVVISGKRYGIDAKDYDIARLTTVFKGQDPRVDVPAALSDMRETFKLLNGRMARAMGLTRDTKQKEPER